MTLLKKSRLQKDIEIWAERLKKAAKKDEQHCQRDVNELFIKMLQMWTR